MACTRATGISWPSAISSSLSACGSGVCSAHGSPSPQAVEGGGHQAVVDPAAAPLALDQARLPEYLEVVRQQVPGDVDHVLDLADAAGTAREHGQDAQAGGIAQRLEGRGQCVGGPLPHGIDIH